MTTYITATQPLNGTEPTCVVVEVKHDEEAAEMVKLLITMGYQKIEVA